MRDNNQDTRNNSAYEGGYGERPPYERPRYEGPPYEGGYGERPSYSVPQPSAQPPRCPPPPLPYGWAQEWEPRVRRAFFVEMATSHSQWEYPTGDSEYASREVPPPGARSGYEGYEDPHETEKSDKKKMLAMGAAGLAVGGVVGAVAAHELGMFFLVMVSLNLPVEGYLGKL